MVNAINQSRTSKMETIPEDWKMLKLSEIGTFRKGKGIARKDLIEEGIPCVLYGEIYTKYHFTAHKLSSYITQETAEKAEIIQNGDILFTGSGETAEEIGKSFVYLGTKKAYAGGDITILSPQNGLPLFLGYITNSTIVNKQKEMHAQGSSVIHIYPKNLEQIKIPYPPIKEQQKIAIALSDMDDLIESLEKIIEKKKKIKQGTMQQLLTGVKRLPGNTETWKENKLGNLAFIKTGTRNNQDQTGDGQYPFFVRSQDVVRINSYSYDCEAVIVPGEGGIGEIFHYIKGKFDAHQRVYVINEFDEISGKYIYYYLKQNFLDHAMKYTVKATVDSLRLPTFQDFMIKYPANKNEQKEIVKILSDMDAEIEALEEKLEKYKKLKEGMMQELLTGRIRLV